jgi:hypothetical protein
MTEQFSVSQSQNVESNSCATGTRSLQKGGEFMEYVIAFAVGGAVALYTLLVRHWLKKA